MKRYEWYSELPPEKVRARLLVRAKPWKSVWDAYDEHRLLVKFLPDGRFYLLQTGGMWSLRPHLPFVGRITPWEAGSLIAGDFTMSKGGWVQHGVMGGIALVAALAVGIPIFTALLAVLAFEAMGYGLIRVAAGDATHPQSRKTLDFIKGELLRE